MIIHKNRRDYWQSIRIDFEKSIREELRKLKIKNQRKVYWRLICMWKMSIILRSSPVAN